MKPEELLVAIGDIDPEMVLSAKNGISSSTVHKTLRCTPLRRHGYKLSIAAAVIVMLITSAVAYWTVGKGFLQFFSKQSEQRLTESEMQYIEENTAGIGQKMTVNGWSVMIDSAICDTNHVYLKIDIEAPKGVNLDAQSYTFRQHTLSAANTETHGVLHVGGTWDVIRDDYSKNNAISLIRTSEMIVPLGCVPSFSSGSSQILRLEDLCVWQGEKEEVIAKGVWTFVFNLSDSHQDCVEFIDHPVVCDAYRMTGKKIQVQLLSFQLSPLGAICTYSFLNGDEQEAVHFSDIKVKMDDGREVNLMPSAGLINSDSSVGVSSFSVGEPLLLHEVDHIILIDGTELSAVLGAN